MLSLRRGGERSRRRRRMKSRGRCRDDREMMAKGVLLPGNVSFPMQRQPL